jgi:hypothetical protein
MDPFATRHYHSHMTSRNLIEEALKLPNKQRGEIVHKLIESLDAEHAEEPKEVERAWAAELEQRADRAIRGETKGRDLDVVCDELVAKRRRQE